MTDLQFGLCLPTFATGSRQVQPSALVQLASMAEEAGLDSIWFLDHFLQPPTYGQSWLDPLSAIAFTAARVERVKLGTCVLVAPLRNPVLLAKEAATLQFLSKGRLILGLGTGWNPREFEAVGVPHAERGRRTDEILLALQRLLTQPIATYEGRHYQFGHVAIEPQPEVPIPLWIGGGTQPKIEGSSERLLKGEAMRSMTSQRVIERIAATDGWCAPPHSFPELVADDWRRISEAARKRGRDPDGIVMAQQAYFHISLSADRAGAYEEQRPAFEGYLGSKRPWSFAKQTYLVGTVEDIVERLRQRTRVGCRYHVLAPVVSERSELEQQITLLTREVIPALRQLV